MTSAPRSKRKSNALLFGMLIWVNAVLLYVYRDFLSLPQFWLGYLAFGLFGVFILGSGRPAVERLSRILAFLILVSSYLISLRYPGTLSFTAGFVGLFSGVGLRAIWYVNFQAEYVHCSVCGADVWATKKKNGVFCNKGHLISSPEPNRAG